MNERPTPPIQFTRAANDNRSKEEEERIKEEEKEGRLRLAEIAFEEKIEEFIEMGLEGSILLELQDEVLARKVHVVENSGTHRAQAFALLKSIFFEYNEDSPNDAIIRSLSENFIKAFKEAYPAS